MMSESRGREAYFPKTCNEYDLGVGMIHLSEQNTVPVG
jgi:hypothetical protein